MIDSIIHVGIGVTNFDKSLPYYREELGLKVARTVEQPDGRRVAFLNAAVGEVVELMYFPPPRPPRPDVREREQTGLNHLGFKVDDVEAEYNRMKALGVEFVGELPPAVPGQNRMIFFYDPDGTRLHITQVAK